MGRRSSGSFRMGLRGKPALILLCCVVLVIFAVLYFRKPSSALKYKLNQHAQQHGHKKSFNMGSKDNFDPEKFVRNGKAEKSKTDNDQSSSKEIYVDKENLMKHIESSNDQHLDLDINNKIKQNDIKNENQKYFDKPIRNKPNLIEENKLHDVNDVGNVHEQFGKAVKNLDKISGPGILDTRNEIERLYHEPYTNSPVDFEEMKRIVHIDLKGAAPKSEYFKQILPVLKELGATGLLVEYEDMFPFEGKLSSVSAGNALTKTNLVELIKLANRLELEIIPLIQTFGHMEFILKLEEFSALRESADTPQVIAPGLDETYRLIQTIIDQIITNHPTSKYIHLGCDEVYELGRGRSGEYMKKNNLTRSEMFFEHVSKNVMYLKQKYPQITPIIWDDEFRHESLEVIKKFGLGNVLEPMIWSYQPNPRLKFSDDIWEKYGKAFKNVWAASSFKGSTGSSQYYTNITHHMSNHLAWIDVILEAKKIAPKMKFRGVTLTGWQRYDHFATLCELLPSAIPSLSLCLKTIKRGGFTQADHKTVQSILSCSDKELTKCTFPGNDLYALILNFRVRENFYMNNVGLQSRLNGWLTDYNIKHGFGSPGQLKVLEKKINQTMANYTSIRPQLENAILKYYDHYTADEWISVHIDQTLKFLVEKYNEAEKLIKVKIFSKRPLVSKYTQINNKTRLGNTNVEPSVNKIQNTFMMPSNSETNRNLNLRQPFKFKPNDMGLIKKPIQGRQRKQTERLSKFVPGQQNRNYISDKNKENILRHNN